MIQNHILARSRRNVRVALALGATAMSLSAPVALAAVVDSGPVSIAVPQTTAGIYLNVVTGVSNPVASSVPGWDLNPFGTSGLGFFTSNSPAISAVVGTGAGATPAALAPGAVIGPASTYATVGNNPGTGTPFQQTGSPYIGFRFMNEVTATMNYGYAQLTTNAATGYPATIIRYVYENTGQAITIPAPATNLFRTYLSPGGADINPCTLAAPCRLLPAALAAVADGGEIWMLDSANYNTAPVAITKSVTILAVPGAVGSVLATGGNAININTAGVKVALRNLVIVPLPGAGGQNGLSIGLAASVTIENCLFANLPFAGIAAYGATNVWITDTIVRDNGDSGIVLQNGPRAVITRSRISGNSVGVFPYAIGAGITTTVDIADSTLEGNAHGIYAKSVNATGVIKVSVRESQVVRNGGNGIAGESGGGYVSISASNNIVSSNGNGIRAFNPGVRMWASGNTVSNNVVGLYNDSGALFETAGDNAVQNNDFDASGAIVVIQPK